MVKKAYIDLEFKSVVTGFEEVNKQIGKLLEEVNKLSESSGKFSASGGGGGTSSASGKPRSNRRRPIVRLGNDMYAPIQYEKSKISAFSNLVDKLNDRFFKSDKLSAVADEHRQLVYAHKIKRPVNSLTKMLIKMGAATGGIMLFTNLVKTIVSQSQVFQSIVQLVFHPFIMMVNFMLLPVLKWLIPNVAEWLQWTVDNKAGLEEVGELLTVIGDALNNIPALEDNPIKTLIETITKMSEIDASDLSPFEKWCLNFQEGVGMVSTMFNTLTPPTLPIGKVSEIVDGIFTTITDALVNASVGETFREKLTLFGESLNSSIETALTDTFNSLMNAIESIPLIGPAVRDFIEGLSSSPASPITTSTATSTSTSTDLSVLLLDKLYTQDNATSLDPTMSSLLRGRMGAW